MMSISTSSSTIYSNSSEDFHKFYCISIPNEHQKKRVIAIIYIVTSLLSILGAGSVLIYAVLKRIVRSPEVHPLFHLALADLILASLWLTGACLWFQKKSQNCFYLDVFGEIAHLASFFLTVNYALTAFIRLQQKADGISTLHISHQVTSSSKFYVWLSRICYALCWLTPVAIMLPLLIHGDNHIPKNLKSCTLCLLLFDRPKLTKSGEKITSVWLSYGSIALTVTLTLSIVAMMVLHFLVLRVYRKAVLYSGVLTDLQRASVDAIRNRICLCILVFLVCWTPALVVASCDIDPSTTLTPVEHWFILFAFQGLTAPMQGFLNCIVYGWARKSFREASDRRPLLLESNEYVTKALAGAFTDLHPCENYESTMQIRTINFI